MGAEDITGMPESMQVLDDLLVLELGDEATQYCGQLLAELGARVIKIEPPAGAAARHRGPFRDDRPDPEGSLYFWAFNTSKESLVLDLETEIDRTRFRQLVARADILLEDGPPGRLEALGLGYDTLARINSGLIVTSITPFGRTGPRAHWQATDMVLWASGGILAGAGYGGNEPPLQSHGDLAYLVGGHSGFVGSLIALVGRDVTGDGEHIDVSIQEACSFINRGAIMLQDGDRTSGYSGNALVPPSPRSYALNLPHAMCKDGKYLLGMTNMIGRANWTQLVEWSQARGYCPEHWGDWAVDLAAMEGARGLMGKPITGFDALLAAIAADHTSGELAILGQSMGFTWAPVNAPDELIDDEHLNARNFFHRVEYEGVAEPVIYPGEPYGFSEAGWQLKSRAPRLGEHGETVAAWLDATGG